MHPVQLARHPQPTLVEVDRGRFDQLSFDSRHDRRNLLGQGRIGRDDQPFTEGMLIQVPENLAGAFEADKVIAVSANDRWQ